MLATTALWSVNAILTLGNVFYLLVNLIFAILLGNSFIRYKILHRPIREFVECWFFIICFEAILSFFTYPGNFPFLVLDEKSLISFILFGISLKENIFKCRYFLFLIFGFIGKSFSAVVSGFLYFTLEYYRRYPVIITFGVISTLILSYELYYLVLADEITIYDKSAVHFMTGSGRFQVWEITYDAIFESTIFQILFGHGFMTERLMLVQSDALWVVDVHNNVLQILYGCGLVGLIYMLYLFALPFYSLNNIMHSLSGNSLYCINIVLFLFGLTASSYLSRPSLSTIFFITYYIVSANEIHKK